MARDNSNPYASPQEETTPESSATSGVDSEEELPLLAATISRWALICSISATPSFVFGLTVSQHRLAIPAMLVGVACFVAAYSFLVRQAFVRELMTRETIGGCIRLTFVIRMVVSVIFPIGGFNDLWVGVLSMQTAGLILRSELSGGSLGPWSVLMTTVIQGLYLNIEIYLAAVLFIGFARLFQSLTALPSRRLLRK